MKHLKYTAFLIIVTLAIVQATHLTLQSPIVEKTGTPLDNMVLSRDIDMQENDEFFAKLAEGN